jgi:hypothetical protein
LPWRRRVAELVDGDVDVDDFVGALEQAVGDGLADGGAGRAVDGVVERFEVLDVDGGHDVDAGVEQLEHVFVALAVACCRERWCGRARRRRRFGMAGEDGVDVHLLEADGAIGDDALRDDFEVADHGFGFGAAVGFNEADDDVDALLRMR